MYRAEKVLRTDLRYAWAVTVRKMSSKWHATFTSAGLGGSVGCASAGDQYVAGSTPAGPATYLVEIDHEIFSAVILSLPLIQEVQLSVSGERMCTIIVNRLED